MKILFLDDMKSRRDVFQQNAIGHTVDFAINAKEAISLLEKNEYDVIYLDHDLGPEMYESNEDHHHDGRYVALKLLEMSRHYNKIVIVHSLNEPCRQSMKSILKNNFDVWMPENIKISELWKIEVDVLIGAIRKYNET